MHASLTSAAHERAVAVVNRHAAAIMATYGTRTIADGVVTMRETDDLDRWHLAFQPMPPPVPGALDTDTAVPDDARPLYAVMVQQHRAFTRADASAHGAVCVVTVADADVERHRLANAARAIRVDSSIAPGAQRRHVTRNKAKAKARRRTKQRDAHIAVRPGATDGLVVGPPTDPRASVL
jgi:hypothetical protein